MMKFSTRLSGMIVLGLLSLGTSWTSAGPGEEEEKKQESIARILVVSGTAAEGAEAVRKKLLLLDRVEATLGKKTKSSEGLEPLRKAYREVAKEVTPEGFAKRLAALYAPKLSTAEVKLILAFYESAAGRKFTKLRTDMTEGTEGVVDTWHEELSRKALDRSFEGDR
jgi:hypothetical protein